MRLSRLDYVVDGEVVWWNRARKNMSIRCTVVAAMGRIARVANEEYRIDTWADVDELYGVREPRYAP